MCGTCVGAEGATLCPPCAAQSFTFPITRSEWSVSWLFSVCLDAFKPQWLMLSVAFVVFIVSYYVLAILAGGVGALIGAGIGQALGEGGEVLSAAFVVLLMTSVALIISAVLALGFNRICLDVLQGKAVSIGTLFSQVGNLHLVVKAWGALMLLYGLAGGAIAALTALVGESGVAIGSLLFIPFGIALGIMMPLLMAGFVVHPELGFIAHVRRTAAMVRGQILKCIGTLLMGGLAIMLGALLCGIGTVPAYGLTMLLVVGLYLTLENDPAFNTSHTPGITGLDTIR